MDNEAATSKESLIKKKSQILTPNNCPAIIYAHMYTLLLIF